MVARQKDVVNFFKKLKKRYPQALVGTTRERRILDHLVFALFFENLSYERGCLSFSDLLRYYIDWNEIRVSKANEIADVVKGIPDATLKGERLRRLLQWIFDVVFSFDLEDTRAKGREILFEFLETVPFSTPFMNAYVDLAAFGSTTIPLDEGALRALRLLGWVSVKKQRCKDCATGGETEIDVEYVPAFEGVFSEVEARDFFFALHELGSELMDDSKSRDAIKFLVSFDSDVAKRSFEPLVESHLILDPREIARCCAKRERQAHSESRMSFDEMMGSVDSDEVDDSDDFKNDESFDIFDERADSESDGLDQSSDDYNERSSLLETSLSKDGATFTEFSTFHTSHSGSKQKGSFSEVTKRASAKSGNKFSNALNSESAEEIVESLKADNSSILETKKGRAKSKKYDESRDAKSEIEKVDAISDETVENEPKRQRNGKVGSRRRAKTEVLTDESVDGDFVSASGLTSAGRVKKGKDSSETKVKTRGKVVASVSADNDSVDKVSAVENVKSSVVKGIRRRNQKTSAPVEENVNVDATSDLPSENDAEKVKVKRGSRKTASTVELETKSRSTGRRGTGGSRINDIQQKKPR